MNDALANDAIAIVGMACRYPDADSPAELWENTLAQRRSFRRIPPERLRLEDYYAADRQDGDSIYITQAALLKDYAFDRVKFRVAGSTFRQADMAHWLALDVAADALDDAGYRDGKGLPRTQTGVVLGNTLTGEFSRASTMRLRWPYVRRVVEAALSEAGWSPEQQGDFLQQLETEYKAPFPPMGEETLAGGLSNTIAGRICNHFDLKGGGYTVDGACASSLLAISTACTHLSTGDWDVALAGGVDLSLDPFELVGFARTNALAPDAMRVYDRRSAGFWPGEGCGFLVLMRAEDAVAQQRRIYALIRGWGVSSDGSGGITRPEVEGQILAVQRAYQRAGFGVESVTYFEGHGTGTAVGDATELRTIAQARRLADPQAPPAVIGSVKANIGHTKAAAGVAGVIKTALALQHQILPPNTGNEDPHPVLREEPVALQVLHEGRPWPPDRPLRAGVSAMGFGGINTHLALEAPTPRRRKALRNHERTLLASAQDAELFLLNARSSTDLEAQIERLLAYTARLSLAELTDLAAMLARSARPGSVRAAVVAATPAELTERLESVRYWLQQDVDERLDVNKGIFLSRRSAPPRIGYLFPGQGTRVYLEGGALRRRFAEIDALYADADLAQYGYEGVETAVAQPAVVTASLAGLTLLEQLGVEAAVAVGHSLGEMTALHWGGALDEATLLRTAAARGQAMMQLGEAGGAMAAITAGQAMVQDLLNGEAVAIACLNSPRHTVISGDAAQVAQVVQRAQAQGIPSQRLPVSHAFHSPLVAPATTPLAEHLAAVAFAPLRRAVVSTVTGAPLSPDEDLAALLVQQVTAPVRFVEAVERADPAVDLWIEVGPGRALSSLAGEFVGTPIVSLDAGGPSLRGLLAAAGALYALGAPLHTEALFADRFHRPFDLEWEATFLVNPCELAPIPEQSAYAGDGAGSNGVHSNSSGIALHPPHEARWNAEREIDEVEIDEAAASENKAGEADVIEIVRQLIAARAELPLAAIADGDRLLSDLHLNSIKVTQIVAEAARRLGIPAPLAPGEFATVTVAEVAQALQDVAQSGVTADQDRPPAGVESWVRAFRVDWGEAPLAQELVASEQVASKGNWQIFVAPDHPLANALQSAFDGLQGKGVALCLPPDPDEQQVDLLLQAAHAALSQPENGRFVLVQHGGGAASVARTLHLEAPHVAVCVVDTPPAPQAVEWIAAEVRAGGEGFREVRYDERGQRWQPRMHLLPLEPADDRSIDLDGTDVLLVTGGGKGITAECALSLAKESGARLALVGRSDPAADAELAANLERMASAGITFAYFAADVANADAVRAAVEQIEARLGPVTGVLHGAARNVPQTLANLSAADVRATLAPKVTGVRNLLGTIPAGQLRHFIGFGSIIAQLGLPGEADYGLANEWLGREIAAVQRTHPGCRCLTIDWSVWAGAGMGERLGTLDSLMHQGITPVPLDAGVQMLHRLLAQPDPLPPNVIVAGRYGDPVTLPAEQPDLPFWRFIETVRVHVTGVELVVDATLSSDSDPYVADHVFQGERLFLAVMGLEAMAQTAMALSGASTPPHFVDVAFPRPIVVPAQGAVTVRLAALQRETGEVDVVLRSEETGFQVDHFRATLRAEALKGEACRFDAAEDLPSAPAANWDNLPALDLDPNAELYERLFFHSGRLRRVKGYRRLTAQAVVAELSPADDEAWFSRYLPGDLLLGDPGARDAAIHALQVCVPAGTLLPVGVDRIVPSCAPWNGPRFVHAAERDVESSAEMLVFDVTICDEEGTVLEVWQGLRLKPMPGTAYTGPWSPAVLGSYVERRLRAWQPSLRLTAVIERVATADRQLRRERALRRALAAPPALHHRPDGRPEALAEALVSLAHAGDLTLALVAEEGITALGCDLEPVTPRSRQSWADLLGAERVKLAEQVARSTGESFDNAATRVWTLVEAAKKAGVALDTPLTLADHSDDGWVHFRAGGHGVASYVAAVFGAAESLALAILAR